MWRGAILDLVAALSSLRQPSPIVQYYFYFSCIFFFYIFFLILPNNSEFWSILRTFFLYELVGLEKGVDPSLKHQISKIRVSHLCSSRQFPTYYTSIHTYISLFVICRSFDFLFYHCLILLMSQIGQGNCA